MIIAVLTANFDHNGNYITTTVQWGNSFVTDFDLEDRVDILTDAHEILGSELFEAELNLYPENEEDLEDEEEDEEDEHEQ